LLLSSLSPVILPVAISLATGQTIFFFRYLYFAHLFMLCAVAVLICRIPQLKLRLLITSVALLDMCAATFVLLQEFDVSHRPGVRGATLWMVQRSGPEEPMIASSSRIYFPLKYYARDRANLVLFHFRDQLQRYGGSQIINPEELVDEEHLRTMKSPRVWIVHTSGFSAKEIPVPKSWRLLESQTFYDAYPWLGAIYARHYLLGKPDPNLVNDAGYLPEMDAIEPYEPRRSLP
jgi:hypothetical protein